MKILYRRELHKTTPTNFLYHVRLTYWLPLQLLWAELYLNLKGTQMGSPPVEQGGLWSGCSSLVCISITTCFIQAFVVEQWCWRWKSSERLSTIFLHSVFLTLNVKAKRQFGFLLCSEPLMQLRKDTAGWLEMYRCRFMDLPGGLSMSRGSSER